MVLTIFQVNVNEKIAVSWNLLCTQYTWLGYTALYGLLMMKDKWDTVEITNSSNIVLISYVHTKILLKF